MRTNLFSKTLKNLIFLILFVGYSSSFAQGKNEVKASVNIALGKPATQSSTGWGGVASRVNDGNTDGDYSRNSVNHTMDDPKGFWMVDLKGNFAIEEIRIWGRTDCCAERVGSTVQVLDKAGQVKWSAPITLTKSRNQFLALPKGIVGSSVRVLNKPRVYLNIAEVMVFGVADGALK